MVDAGDPLTCELLATGEAPLLVRIETRAGHGSGKPTAMAIEEIADQWAFLVKVLEIPLNGTPGADSR